MVTTWMLKDSAALEVDSPNGSERTLAQQLFRRISEAIIRGDLSAGSKISEPALARQYGVSRGPLREALEGMAAHEAARQGTTAEIAAIRASHERYVRSQTESTDAPPSYRMGSADADFHFLVAQASHNPTLITLLCSDLDLLLRFYRSRLRDLVGRVPRVLIEHARIVEAIEERDVDMAELHMRRHISAAREALSELIGSTEGGES